MASAALTIFYLAMPMLILHGCYKSAWLGRIGPVVLAYVAGFLMGNSGLLSFVSGYRQVQEVVSALSIPLAIPLMLFSMDLRRWARMAVPTVLSMLWALVAATFAVVSGFFLLRGQGVAEWWNVAGMMMGLYTGGTPNLASIKMALGANETHFMVIATYDLLVGAVHLLFMVSIAQRIFLKILKPYAATPKQPGTLELAAPGEEPYWGLLQKQVWRPLGKALVLAVLILVGSGLASRLLPGISPMALVILLVTTLGIMASFVPAVRHVEKTYELGMYLIMVFCMVVASMADLRQVDMGSAVIGIYVVWVVVGSMLVHALLCRISGIDTDTFLITSTAFICSPAIVPVVVSALRNREVLFSGLSVGIMGYAMGNYLGLLVAWVLEGAG